MDYLAPQRFIDYNDWIKIYWVFINENFSLDLFEYYSKKHYPAYNKEENLKFISLKSFDSNDFSLINEPTIENYILKKNLGTGSFGSVFKAKNKIDSKM